MKLALGRPFDLWQWGDMRGNLGGGLRDSLWNDLRINMEASMGDSLWDSLRAGLRDSLKERG